MPPLYVVGVRRAGPGRYTGGSSRLDLPTEGTRRERVAAILERRRGAFERAIAVAPEQWWAVFFPIWPDLTVSRRTAR